MKPAILLFFSLSFSDKMSSKIKCWSSLLSHGWVTVWPQSCFSLIRALGLLLWQPRYTFCYISSPYFLFLLIVQIIDVDFLNNNVAISATLMLFNYFFFMSTVIVSFYYCYQPCSLRGSFLLKYTRKSLHTDAKKKLTMKTGSCLMRAANLLKLKHKKWRV